jgi:RNA-directed DNA polymerase
VSSGSEAKGVSDRHAAVGGGVARTTEEAGQRPQREGAAQNSLPSGRHTAAPEADMTVSTKLAGLVARARKEARLTNVIQFVDEELLHLAFRSLRKQAAPGVDGQSYEDYAKDLPGNLRDLHERLRSGRYRAPAVRRAYIPKASGKLRPLGITTIEDRVVQKAVTWVLSVVHEQDFLEVSHGFRPKRGPHTALHRLRQGIMQGRARYVVEVDVVGYFDAVQHEWLRKFVRHRINEGGLLRLLNKWLKAGVMEQGIVTRTEDGVPQGGPVSPVLANVYLHYVLDLWFERRFKKTCRAFAELTRFADDFVAVFRNQDDAERFRRDMEERLAAFGLHVAPEKTAVRCFDGSLLQGRKDRADRLETFTFLGFTHYLRRSLSGFVHVARKPSVKTRERFLREVAAWLQANQHVRVWVHQAHLTRVLRGFYQYFGLRLCGPTLNGVRWRVRKLWWWTLRRRSQKARRRCDWPSLNAKPWFQLPYPRVMHAWV